MNTRESKIEKKLLIVGPIPPPLGGSSLTVQAIIDEISKYPEIKLSIVNTSPTRDIRKKMTGFNVEKVWRMISMLPKYLWNLKGSDAVLVFANNLFALLIAPVFLLFARAFRKPFYLKPVGGDLDLFIESLGNPIRELFLGTLRTMNGIFAQTKLLQESLINLGCPNAIYLPGFRTKPAVIDKAKPAEKTFRLIFLAHIMRSKGPLVLLEALQLVSKTCAIPVYCDFYGPIHHEIHDDFLMKLEEIQTAQYCGIADPGCGVSLIANYDALVLPTYFICEGHTGVLIEAMHASVPVISTKHRSIPELVTDGVNGILVPTQDSKTLADAIRKMALNPSMREKMGQKNAVRGEEFRTEEVVAQLTNTIFQLI